MHANPHGVPQPAATRSCRTQAANVVAGPAYRYAELVIASFTVLRLRIERESVLAAKIVGNFLDSPAKFTVISRKERLGSGFACDPAENIARIIDVTAVRQKDLRTRPAHHVVFRRSEVADRVDLRFRLANNAH